MEEEEMVKQQQSGDFHVPKMVGTLHDIIHLPGRDRVWEMELLWLRELAESGLSLQRQHVAMPNRKPENIHVCEDGFLYETDVGAAVDLSTDPCHITPRSRKGTVGYSDPLYLVSGRCQRKTDIWNFGVIMGEMVTGLAAAFTTSSGEQVTLADILRDYSTLRLSSTIAQCAGYPPDVALQIVNLIKRCLASSPSDRPDFAEILAMLRLVHPTSNTLPPLLAPSKSRR
eukprot:GHVS01038527.1.p1 GENE.GHVS01038527.1~~GHVS01038527.1.p1  ORF type:complete len:228 (-),score=47.16 GHVS01038527.1:193-876(-)